MNRPKYKSLYLKEKMLKDTYKDCFFTLINEMKKWNIKIYENNDTLFGNYSVRVEQDREHFLDIKLSGLFIKLDSEEEQNV